MTLDAPALFDLTNKTALVTGGSRGLGLEAAIALAEAGASVAITGRRLSWLSSAAEELRRRGHLCRTFKCDVSDEAQAARAVRDAADNLGALDILVNNAGISWASPAEELPIEKWNEVMATNATGTFLTAQAAMREMQHGGLLRGVDERDGGVEGKGSVRDASSNVPNNLKHASAPHPAVKPAETQHL